MSSELIKWLFIIYSSAICLLLGLANFQGKRFFEFENKAQKTNSRLSGYNHRYHK